VTPLAPGHSDEARGKISAVHFVRFFIPADLRRTLASVEVTLVVDEHARATLSAESKRSLAEDLA
jgi:hypothetical protein